MKNFKKTISSVLVFAMLCTMGFSVVAEDENDDVVTLGIVDEVSDANNDDGDTVLRGAGPGVVSGGGGGSVGTVNARTAEHFVLNGLGGASTGVTATFAPETTSAPGKLTVKGKLAYVQAGSTSADPTSPPVSGWYATIGIIAPDDVDVTKFKWNGSDIAVSLEDLGSGDWGIMHYPRLFEERNNSVVAVSDTDNKRTIKWCDDAGDTLYEEALTFVGDSASTKGAKTTDFKVLGMSGGKQYEIPVTAVTEIGTTAISDYYNVDVSGYTDINFRSVVTSAWTDHTTIDTTVRNDGTYKYVLNGGTLYIAKNAYSVEGTVSGVSKAADVYLIPYVSDNTVVDLSDVSGYVKATTAASGAFTFSTVLPGKYAVYVQDENYTTKIAGVVNVISANRTGVAVTAKSVVNTTVIADIGTSPTGSPAPITGSAPMGVPNKVTYRLTANRNIGASRFTVDYSGDDEMYIGIGATVGVLDAIVPPSPGPTLMSISGSYDRDIIGLTDGDELVITLTTMAGNTLSNPYGYDVKLVEDPDGMSPATLFENSVTLTPDNAGVTKAGSTATIKYYYTLMRNGITQEKRTGGTATRDDGTVANISYNSSYSNYRGYYFYEEGNSGSKKSSTSTICNEVVEGGKTYILEFNYEIGTSGSGSSGGSNPLYYGAGSTVSTSGGDGSNTRFSDTAIVPWAEDAIEMLAQLGIISGRGDGTFGPEEGVTREEFTKMVCGAFEIKGVEGTTPFSDVVEGAWYEQFVLAAVNAGIINGYDDGTFGVGRLITREEVCTILLRAIQSKYQIAVTTFTTFADNDEIQEWAKGGVATLSNNGLVKGYEDNTFRPKNNTTRAEAAVLIYRIYARYVQ